MTRRATTRRQQELRQLAERARALPDGHAQRIWLVAVAYAFGVAGLQLALLVAAVRAARRGWPSRGRGAAAVADAARSGPLLTLAGCYAAYRTLGRFVLTRWMRRTVHRFEPPTAPPA